MQNTKSSGNIVSANQFEAGFNGDLNCTQQAPKKSNKRDVIHFSSSRTNHENGIADYWVWDIATTFTFLLDQC